MSETQSNSNSASHLRRVLGRWDLVLLFVVAVVNLNVVPVVAGAGPITLWFWLAGVFLFFWPQGIAVIELSHRYPGEGGIYLWTKELFGDFHGFLSGWCYWTNNVFYVPTVLFVLVGISVYVGGERASALGDQRWFVFLISVGLLWLMAALNVRGLGVGKWINNLGGIGTAVGALALMGLALVVTRHQGLRLSLRDFGFAGADWRLVSTFGVICFGLVGLELGSVMGDEIEDPRRTVPGAVLWGGVISGLLYIGVTLATLLALPRNDIGVVQGTIQAVNKLARDAGVPWIVPPLALVLSISMAGIASAWFVGSARIPFVAGLDRYLPPALGKIHPRYATPYVALIVHASLSSLFVAMNLAGASVKEAFVTMLDLAVFLQLVPFLYMFAALVRLAGRGAGESAYYSRRTLLVAGGERGIRNDGARNAPGLRVLREHRVRVAVRSQDARGLRPFPGRGRLLLQDKRGPQGPEGFEFGERALQRSGRFVVKPYQNFINGEWAESQRGDCFPVLDPSTEEVIAEVPDSGAQDVDRAVRAARAAFDSGPWPQTTAQERGRILFRLAERLRKESALLAELESLNCGKPIVEAEYDIADAATCFEYYGGLATKVMGHVNPVPDNALSLTLKEPVGVAAQIIPWNYPLLMAAWKLAPAIAAGCTCILKPAEQTPLTALEMANWFGDAGLPPGVVNFITGFGETAGAPLVEHPEVNKVAFTGSAEVGKKIVKMAAETVKRVTLELGGKSPNIFFADADLEAATDGALFGVFINQGEVCSAGSRILVERAIYPRFLEMMTEKAKRIRLGPPLSRETKMGPLISKAQFERVRSYQELGKKEAKLALGGGRAGDFARGYYVEPTIFYDVPNSARIAREEIFGPVAAVIPFEGEADAIRIANDSPYGLAAAVWSRDIYRALRVVKALRAGIVWVNHMQPTYVEAPWGGYKQSGFGRELGPSGIEEYLETKQVHINLNEQPIGWY